MTSNTLHQFYRQTLRLQRLLKKNSASAYDPPYFYEPFFKEYLPKFQDRSFTLDGEKFEIFQKKFDSLSRLTQNKALSKFPPSQKMREPKRNPHYYLDLVDQLHGKSTPSRKSLYQQFFLKWFRLKI
ncbi:hypothetical protein HMI56_002233 [Coelomomyces lativittatus]|nr:hypothetical protein HMI56_002233 [Coelomomyces lativittatus]